MPRVIIVLLALCAPTGLAWGEGTDNHRLVAVPTPGPIAIDGNLADWDRSGRILVCSDTSSLVGITSAWVMMMYDAQALFVAVDWSDSTPMVNDYDPDLDIERRKCFHADSLQIHLRSDCERKFIGWWYRPSRRAAVISLDGWMPWDDKPIVYHDAIADMGVTEAFARKADGTGYIQEMRIPWRAISAAGRPYRAGDQLDCMLDLVWGPDSGKGWPRNHMMDLVSGGAVHTGWFWEVPRIYGQIILSANGHLPALPSTPMPVSAPAHEGALVVHAQLPDAEAPYFSLAIDDDLGHRVRTLPGSCLTAEHRMAGTKATVTQDWDGLDDLGHLVAPGTYRIIGLTRGELSATYEQCFYNPGTPPWPTADGTGAWGADHTPPTAVAASGDGVVLGWAGVEGGSGMIGVGADGRKRWGQPQGGRLLAASGDDIYFILDDFWSGKHGLGRLAARDGRLKAWVVDGHQELPIDLPRALGGRPASRVGALAAHADRLLIACDDGVLAEFNATTASVVRTMRLSGVAALAYASDDVVFALVSGALQRIDLARSLSAPILVPGLGCGQALARGTDGNLVIADGGPDHQLKVISATGRLLRCIGRTGGRARQGPIDAASLGEVSSVAVDAQGFVWAVECGDMPRRVSVWGTDGGLVRDYIGNAAYSASGTYLHDQDPTLAYAGGVEMRRDPGKRTWSATQVLWNPDAALGQRFPINGGLATPQRFTSAASGSAHEYLLSRSDWGDAGFTLYMQRPDGWRPVSAICLVGHLSGRIEQGKVAEEPGGEFSGLDAFDGVFWNDLNGDGIAQRNECTILPSRQQAGGVGRSGQAPLPLSNGWGGRMGSDLSIYADGVVIYRPISFSSDGAPCYGPLGMQHIAVEDRGDMVPIDDEHRLLILSSTGYGAESYVRAVEYGSWRECWRYPSHSHGVHGSHHAAMPSPGSIIGALKILGVAHLDQGGSIFAIRGNLGQDFLMTSDGLYVGELFRDCREPSPPLPVDEASLAGTRIDEQSEGGEPFNGWFGRQKDGVVRICTGIPGQAAMVAQVHGLESIRRCDAGSIAVDLAALVECDRQHAEGAVAQAPRKRLTIHRLAAEPHFGADGGDWASIKPETIAREGATEHARVRLGHDARMLYAVFEVDDASPWRNGGQDAQRLFKSGDAVDIQLVTDPQQDQRAVGPGHLRLLIAPFAGRSVCVLMKPVDAHAPADLGITYRSPVAERHFDRVAVLEDATVSVHVEAGRYRVEVAIPLSDLGMVPAAGQLVHGDVGFISSNAAGTTDVGRTYWSNAATNLVNDMPSEAWLYPATWGEMTWE